MSGLDVKLELIGDKDVERMLRGWSPAAQRRITRPGITKISRMVAKQAKANAPRKSGVLKKSIGQVVRTYPSGVVVGIIGPRHGYEAAVQRSTGTVITKKNVAEFHDTNNKIVKQNPVKYAHLVEAGTQSHTIGKGSKLVERVFTGATVVAGKTKRYRKKNYDLRPGQQRGIRHPGSKASHFLRRAFFSVVPHAKAVMRESVKENVIREARRLLKKRGISA